MASNNEFQKFSFNLVNEAGKYAIKMFDGKFKVSSKDKKNNLVTEVDTNSQELIINLIRSKYPSHSIIGEEDQNITNNNASKYVWVIDPVDGTTNFANGIPNFSISVALLKNSEPIAGAIWIPWPNKSRSLIFHTGKGEGAWVNEKKLDISNITSESLTTGGVSSFSSAKTIFGDKDRKIKPFNQELNGENRVIGSVAYEMALVAKGSIKFALLGPASIWDFGAGLLLIKEAKGKIICLDKDYKNKGEFETFLIDYKEDKQTYQALRNWNGQFYAGSNNIINSKKFV